MGVFHCTCPIPQTSHPRHSSWMPDRRWLLCFRKGKARPYPSDAETSPRTPRSSMPHPRAARRHIVSSCIIPPCPFTRQVIAPFAYVACHRHAPSTLAAPLVRAASSVGRSRPPFVCGLHFLLLCAYACAWYSVPLLWWCAPAVLCFGGDWSEIFCVGQLCI